MLKKSILLTISLLFIASSCFAADWYVSSSAGGGGVGSVGDPFTLVEAIAQAKSAGDNVYVKADGTYTLAANATENDNGTAAAPIVWRGYTTTITDNGQATIACGAYYFYWNVDYNKIRNFSFTGTAAVSVYYDANRNSVENCKFNNSSGTADRVAVQNQGPATGMPFINCEAECVNGTAIKTDTSKYVSLHACYIHDSKVGFASPTGYSSVTFSIFDTCTTGISNAGGSEYLFSHNIVYNSTTGISGTLAGMGIYMNNIIDSCTTGASWSAASKGADYWDYNNWNNNGTDVTNVTKGSNATAVAPAFTDAPNGDFSVGTNMKATGFPGAFPGGLTTGYLDQGAVQREEAAAGGATDYAF